MMIFKYIMDTHTNVHGQAGKLLYFQIDIFHTGKYFHAATQKLSKSTVPSRAPNNRKMLSLKGLKYLSQKTVNTKEWTWFGSRLELGVS